MTRALALLLLIGVSLTACDETDPADMRSDNERLVGTWDASAANVRVRGGLRVPVADLAQADDEQTFTFGAGNRFTFVFDPQDGRTVSISALGQTFTVPVDQTVRFSGTYVIDTPAQTIRFVPMTFDTDESFQLGYRFNSGTLELSAEDPETLGKLFGLADADLSQLSTVVTGGSITYQKAGA